MSDQLLSLNNVRSILEKDIPDLTIETIQYLSEGFQNKLFLINGNIIARMSKSQKSSLLAQSGLNIQREFYDKETLPHRV